MKSTQDFLDKIGRVKTALENADAVLIGAGAGLSTSAGLSYGGERFLKYFADFHNKYGIGDMYSGGFYPFETLEEYWAWWSRHIYYNRYKCETNGVYETLLSLVKDKEYFVLTTNVDHCFQKAGFDKRRLFYTQGDYGLFQCSRPCHEKTYDNEKTVTEMVARQQGMKIPSSLIPYCPVCGKPMTVNLRCDNTFVEDEGWHRAKDNYAAFVKEYKNKKLLLLELGVGENTPVIIKYPFWNMAYKNKNALYACINLDGAYAPQDLKNALCLPEDIGVCLHAML